MKREHFLIITAVVILLCLYRLSNRENFIEPEVAVKLTAVPGTQDIGISVCPRQRTLEELMEDGTVSNENGDGTNGDGTNGSGTNGSGTNGDGTNGDGTNGSGTNGDGTNGSGTNGATESENCPGIKNYPVIMNSPYDGTIDITKAEFDTLTTEMNSTPTAPKLIYDTGEETMLDPRLVWDEGTGSASIYLDADPCDETGVNGMTEAQWPMRCHRDRPEFWTAGMTKNATLEVCPGTNGDGTNGSGTNGSGTNGDGTNGDGTNGSGTNGGGVLKFECVGASLVFSIKKMGSGQFSYTWKVNGAPDYSTLKEITLNPGDYDEGPLNVQATVIDGEGKQFVYSTVVNTTDQCTVENPGGGGGGNGAVSDENGTNWIKYVCNADDTVTFGITDLVADEAASQIAAGNADPFQYTWEITNGELQAGIAGVSEMPPMSLLPGSSTINLYITIGSEEVTGTLVIDTAMQCSIPGGGGGGNGATTAAEQALENEESVYTEYLGNTSQSLQNSITNALEPSTLSTEFAIIPNTVTRRFNGTKAECEAECDKTDGCKGFVRLSGVGQELWATGDNFGNVDDTGTNWCLLTDSTTTYEKGGWDSYFKNST